jgi:hypothetical protein
MVELTLRIYPLEELKRLDNKQDVVHVTNYKMLKKKSLGITISTDASFVPVLKLEVGLHVVCNHFKFKISE